MKKFYQAAATILISRNIKFTFKVSEVGSKIYTHLTSSLFYVALDANNKDVIWVEDNASNWRRFGKTELVGFKSHITKIAHEQK